jgi:hypothetical protein
VTQLPSGLKKLQESHRKAITHACQVHNDLQVEIILAEQYYGSIISAAERYEVHINATREKLRKIKHHMGSCVNIALDQLDAAKSVSSVRREYWRVPENTQLQCPWEEPLLSHHECKRQVGMDIIHSSLSAFQRLGVCIIY